MKGKYIWNTEVRVVHPSQTSNRKKCHILTLFSIRAVNLFTISFCPDSGFPTVPFVIYGGNMYLCKPKVCVVNCSTTYVVALID